MHPLQTQYGVWRQADDPLLARVIGRDPYEKRDGRGRHKVGATRIVYAVSHDCIRAVYYDWKYARAIMAGFGHKLGKKQRMGYPVHHGTGVWYSEYCITVMIYQKSRTGSPMDSIGDGIDFFPPKTQHMLIMQKLTRKPIFCHHTWSMAGNTACIKMVHFYSTRTMPYQSFWYGIVPRHWIIQFIGWQATTAGVVSLPCPTSLHHQWKLTIDLVEGRYRDRPKGGSTYVGPWHLQSLEVPILGRPRFGGAK